MIINLYTARVILNVLGIEDFGIYNIVGGLVLSFSLFSASITGAIQRFITFELGKQRHHSQEIFSASISIIILLALGCFILLETVGLWVLNSKLNIAPDRMFAANWVFQLSIIAFVINLISIPYNATIIAYERMKAFAYIGILEAVLKLVTIAVLYYTPGDALIIYAISTCCIALIIRCIYGVYCNRNFSDCRVRFIWDKERYSEILKFAGWTFIGSSSTILMTQGVNILINIFFGVTLNAARGIAVQVENIVTQFSQNFTTALNPQITKSYASGDHKYMMELLLNGARFSFYLMLIISIPIIISTNELLLLWLNDVPEYATIFIQLSLVYTLLQTLSNPLITAMLATGDIKKYQLIVGGLQLTNFPLAYIAYKLGANAEYSYYIAIIIALGCLSARLVLLRRMINLPISTFLKKVLANTCFVGFAAFIIPHLICQSYQLALFPKLLICVISSISMVVCIGFNNSERKQLKNKTLKFIHL